MLGYLLEGKIERKDDFVNGWLRTGDVCKRKIGDEKIYYVERKKNTIKCNGENLYPALIRRVIIQTPNVEEAKVEAKADKEMV